MIDNDSNFIEFTAVCVGIFMFLIPMTMTGILAIRADLKQVNSTIRTSLEKRATPKEWAKNLHSYFLERGDKEGQMLTETIIKSLSKKKPPKLPDLGG